MNRNDEITDQRERGWLWIHNIVIDHYGPVIGVHAIAVYAKIALHASKAQRMAFPSYQTIAQTFGISRRTAIIAVKRLEVVGLIKREQRKKSGNVEYMSNLYTILTPLSLGSSEQEIATNQDRLRQHITELERSSEGGSAYDAPPWCTSDTTLVHHMHYPSAPGDQEQDSDEQDSDEPDSRERDPRGFAPVGAADAARSDAFALTASVRSGGEGGNVATPMGEEHDPKAFLIGENQPQDLETGTAPGSPNTDCAPPPAPPPADAPVAAPGGPGTARRSKMTTAIADAVSPVLAVPGDPPSRQSRQKSAQTLLYEPARDVITGHGLNISSRQHLTSVLVELEQLGATPDELAAAVRRIVEEWRGAPYYSITRLPDDLRAYRGWLAQQPATPAPQEVATLPPPLTDEDRLLFG